MYLPGSSTFGVMGFRDRLGSAWYVTVSSLERNVATGTTLRGAPG